MNQGGEVADQMARESLQFAEVAVKLMALGFKNALSITLAYMKENPKVRGKTNLDRLLREGKELKVISIQKKDMGDFKKHAEQYGVLFAEIKDKKGEGEKTDIMFKAEDVGKLNRIYEQMGYMVPKQTGQSRKKEQTRRPSDSGFRTHGRTVEVPSGEAKDTRPSVRFAIQKAKAAAKQAAEQLRQQAQQQENAAPGREER